MSRYNISTGEYDGWDSAVNSSIGRTVDSVLNGATVAGQGSPLERRLFSELTDVYERFGFTYDEAREVCYVLNSYFLRRAEGRQSYICRGILVGCYELALSI